MKGKVTCSSCGWSWNKSDSSQKDMYICHECGRDNSNNMKNGGWLDNIPQAQDGEVLYTPPKSQYKRLYGHASEAGIGENENMRIDPNTGYSYFPQETSLSQEKEVPNSPWNVSRFLFDPFIRNVSQGIHNAKYNNKGEYIDSPGDVIEQGYLTSGMSRRERYDAAKKDITSYYKEDLKQNDDTVEKNVDNTMDLVRKMRRAEEMMQRQNETYKNFQNPEEVFKKAVGFYGDDNEINPSEAKRAYKMFQKTWRGTSGKEARQNSREELKKAKEAFKLSKEQMRKGLPKPDPNYVPEDFANGGILKNGGWLDNYNDYEVSAPEGFEGDGYSNVGRNYSPAWGGQFKEGGIIPNAQNGWLEKIDNVLSAPARAATYAVEAGAHAIGARKAPPKYEDPSDGLGIDEKEHPYLKLATDIVLDPTNLLGVGAISKIGKLAKGVKTVQKTKNVLQPAVKTAFDAATKAGKASGAITWGRNLGKQHKAFFKEYDVLLKNLYKPEVVEQALKLGAKDAIGATAIINDLIKQHPEKKEEILKNYKNITKQNTNKNPKQEVVAKDKKPKDKKPEYTLQEKYNYDPGYRALKEYVKVYDTPEVKQLQNNLHPEGLVTGNTDLYSELPTIRPTAKNAKSYKVKETVQGKYAPSTVEYEVTDPRNINMNDLGPGNTRVVTPEYQMGGNVYPVNYVPQAQKGKKAKKVFKKELEDDVDDFLGNPQERARYMSETNPDEAPSDSMRHSFAGRYTQDAIAKKFGNGVIGNIAGLIGSNAMGAAHELSTLSKDKRDWSTKLRESGEDMFNNAVGSVIGALPYMDEKAKDDMMRKMVYGNLLPDGYVSTPEGVKKGLSSNIYFKNDRGQVKRNYAMGGSLPGSPGFTYARTIEPAPDNGPYAKKTMASAQNGKNLNPYTYPKPDHYSRMNPFVFQDPQHGIFIGGVNPTYSTKDFSIGASAVGVGNKDFVNPLVDYGIRGSYSPMENLHLTGSVSKNNIGAGLNYRFENGGEMSYYQHGLDWKPKGMENGGWLGKYEQAQKGAQTSKSKPAVKFDPKQFAKDFNLNLTPQQRALKASTDKEAQSEDYRRWVSSDEYKKAVKAQKIAEDKATIAQRKANIAKSDKAKLNQWSTDVLKPSNWTRENLADAAAGLGDKARLFPDDPDSFIDEWLNPGVMIGGMAQSLGEAPLQAKETDSYLPYVTAIGAPLLTGALEGLGANTTKQFVNNLINPFNIVPGYKTAEKFAMKKAKDVLFDATSYGRLLNKKIGNQVGIAKSLINDPNVKLQKPLFLTSKDEVYQNINKGAGVLEDRISRKIMDLQSPEGMSRLVNQEKEYLEGIGFTGDISEQALKNANARIEELEYMEIFGNKNKNFVERFKQDDFVPSYIPLIHPTRKPTISQAMKATDIPDVNAYYQSPPQLELTKDLIGIDVPPSALNPYTISSTRYYQLGEKPAFGQLALGQGMADAADTADHEINHALQRDRVLKIDNDLKDLQMDYQKNLSEDEIKDYLYFAYGSGGQESSAFLADFRKQMLDNGLINHIYEPISPEKVAEAVTYFKQNPNKIVTVKPTGLRAHSKARIANFVRPNQKNFELLSKSLNKLPTVVPGAIGLGAASQLNNEEEVPEYKQGGIIKDDMGQWAHPGEITEIGSNNITMQGVPYDVLGISDTGDTKLMKPGKNYKFKGKKVTEFPMAKNGVNQQDEKTFEQLDQLTNFTNYNKPQPGGWLNKYN
jgi:hypothetical protein